MKVSSRLIVFPMSGPRCIGKLPLKSCRKPLKEFAHAWAENQDVLQLQAAVAEYGVRATPEGLLQALESLAAGAGADDTGRFRGRDERVAFQALVEIAAALGRYWRRLMSMPAVVWECAAPSPSEQDCRSVLDWLFRRGKN